MSREKTREVPVRNNPGIYRRMIFDEGSKKWLDTGKFRAIRRVRSDGVSKKEQSIWNNIEDAKAFRAGTLGKQSLGDVVQKNNGESRYTFGELVDEWKRIHFLEIQKSTRQKYEKLLPYLDTLKFRNVKDINVSVVDELIYYWVRECPQGKQRETYRHELVTLRAILNFYRERKDPSYGVPILSSHFKAADVAKKGKKQVKSLEPAQLGLFVGALRAQSGDPQHASVALAQFGLGLRIAEACGLAWPGIDLNNREARIFQTIVWDQYTWEPDIKPCPKNSKERVLTIPEFLIKEFERLYAARTSESDLVFHRRGKPLSAKTIRCAYNRALKKIGLNDISGTHILRKTCSTEVLELTGDLHAVQRMLDHSKTEDTLRYVRQKRTQRDKVAGAVDQIAEVAFGKPQKVAQETVGGDANTVPPVPECPRKIERPKLRLVKSTA